MRHSLKPLVLAAIALAAVPALAAEGWLTSYDAAVKASKKSGKPILVDFTGSNWCGWCKKLDKEVFSTSEFKTWAKKNVVLLSLDFPQGIKQDAGLKKQNEGLAKKYEVQGFPTVLFLDAKGKKLGEYGYDEGGPKTWTSNAEKKFKK
ncbi:thioredoxin family protein [bacterium]|nr:MAG: thioredoxin family protein [bacterium]